MDKMKTNPFHTTDVKELAIDGTVVAAGAAELDQFMLTGTILDISTGASSWAVSPCAATVEAIYLVVEGATTGTAAITFEIGGTAITDSAISIVASGSGAGVVDSSTPTALNTVTAGQAIEIITDGGSTNTVIAVVTLVMKRT